MSEPSAPLSPEERFRKVLSALGKQKAMEVAGKPVTVGDIASQIPSFAPITGEATTLDSLRENLKQKSYGLAALDALGLGAGVPLGKLAGAGLGMVGKRFAKGPRVSLATSRGQGNTFLKGAGGEISDAGSYIDEDILDAAYRMNKPVKLREVMKHPELFDAYPELRDLEVRGGITPSYARMVEGEKQVGKPWIEMPTGSLHRMTVNTRNLPDHPDYLKTRKSSMLHEVQHAVQDLDKRNLVDHDSDLDGLQHASSMPESESRLTEIRAELLPHELVDNPRDVDINAQLHAVMKLLDETPNLGSKEAYVTVPSQLKKYTTQIRKAGQNPPKSPYDVAISNFKSGEYGTPEAPKRGAAHRAAFWDGYNGVPNSKLHGPKGSIGAESYRAGVDARKKQK